MTPWPKLCGVVRTRGRNPISAGSMAAVKLSAVQLKRRVHDQIVNDAGLVGDVAEEVAKALGLDGTTPLTPSHHTPHTQHTPHGPGRHDTPHTSHPSFTPTHDAHAHAHALAHAPKALGLDGTTPHTAHTPNTLMTHTAQGRTCTHTRTQMHTRENVSPDERIPRPFHSPGYTPACPHADLPTNQPTRPPTRPPTHAHAHALTHTPTCPPMSAKGGT